MTHTKYDPVESVGENFEVNFMIRVPRRQTTDNLTNKLRSTGRLIDTKQKHKRQVLTKEKLDIGARLEHTPKK
jgi:hypothetical protein